MNCANSRLINSPATKSRIEKFVINARTKTSLIVFKHTTIRDQNSFKLLDVEDLNEDTIHFYDESTY